MEKNYEREMEESHAIEKAVDEVLNRQDEVLEIEEQFEMEI